LNPIFILLAGAVLLFLEIRKKIASGEIKSAADLLPGATPSPGYVDNSSVTNNIGQIGASIFEVGGNDVQSSPQVKTIHVYTWQDSTFGGGHYASTGSQTVSINDPRNVIYIGGPQAN
jgi:hypothetical protein